MLRESRWSVYASPSETPAARTPPARWQLALWALVLGALVGVVYAGVVDTFFIADDLCDLVFLRGVRASFWEHLNPFTHYTDATTQSRFVPISLCFRAAMFASFDASPRGYHLVSLALHAASALVTGLIAWTLFRDWPVALAASCLFAAFRVNGQAVGWISAGHLLLSDLLALGALWWWVRGGKRRSRGAPALYALAALTHPTAIAFPALALSHAIATGDKPDRGAVAGLAAAASIVLGLDAISLYYFPTVMPAPSISWRRAAAFLLTMVFPFEAPLRSKIAVAFALVVGIVWSGDRRLYFLFLCAVAGALFWSVFPVGYPLVPRYFYLYASPFVIGVVALSRMLTQRAGAALAVSRATLNVAFAVTAAVACVIHAAAVMRSDVVWFQYLAEQGAKLQALARRPTAHQERREVTFVPFGHLPERDLAFFDEYFRFVPSSRATPATIRVDTGAATYMRLMARRFGRRQWLHPWLTDVRELH